MLNVLKLWNSLVKDVQGSADIFIFRLISQNCIKPINREGYVSYLACRLCTLYDVNIYVTVITTISFVRKNKGYSDDDSKNK